MGETFNKKEREKKKEKTRKDKQMRKEQRKENSGGGWESMMAYVDENGVIHDTPPDPSQRTSIDAESIEIGIPKRSEEDEIDTSLSGTINFYDDAKGYGFIKSGEESFFMHSKSILKGIPAQGKKVSFEKEKGPKGWAAVRVEIL